MYWRICGGNCYYGGYTGLLERINFDVCPVIVCDDDYGDVILVSLLCDSGPLDDFWDEVIVGNVGVSMARPLYVEGGPRGPKFSWAP